MDLEASKSKYVALDIIAYSYLLRLSGYVKDLVVNNYHDEITERSNVIRGKWDISKDLTNSQRPVSFTCTYGTISKNNPFLLFAKSFTVYLSHHVRSSKCLAEIDSIIRDLKDVEMTALNRKLLEDAKSWINKHEDFRHMKGGVDFAESFFLNNEVSAKEAGFSYQFPMDKFFEDLMERFLNLDRNFKVFSQNREELLGGAIWQDRSDSCEEGGGKTAAQYSIPDIIAFNEKKYLILECKYKPFKIPFVNNQISDPTLVSFGRNDRNQILSFLMSLRPSALLAKRQLEICILFPCNTIETFKRTDLLFESAKMNIDPLIKKIVQNKLKVMDNTCLKISFVGLNLNKVVEAVFKYDVSYASAFYDVFQENTNVIELGAKNEKFANILDRRVSLANIIVNELKDDRTLGRVKMAKILYLADAHLKLSLNGSYVREAAGPLDQRLLYNEKVGVEAIASKHSYFNTIKTKDGLGNRYVRSSNFEAGLKRAVTQLYDKIDNINWLIKLMSPLDTERSEIVATLYACWNDLKNRKPIVSDDEIVNDFRKNWHISKERFQPERIQRALGWMKDVGLIPDGNGPLCSPKHEKIPSGF